MNLRHSIAQPTSYAHALTEFRLKVRRESQNNVPQNNFESLDLVAGQHTRPMSTVGPKSFGHRRGARIEGDSTLCIVWNGCNKTHERSASCGQPVTPTEAPEVCIPSTACGKVVVASLPSVGISIVRTNDRA